MTEAVAKSSARVDSKLRRQVRTVVQSALDPEVVLSRRARDEEGLRRELAVLVERAAREGGAILPAADLSALQRSVIDDVLGYGPLQPLLDDASIQEVMVNAPDEIYVERSGRLERVSFGFDDEAHVMAVVERILRRLGRRVDESSPAVDARIPELGFRVHVIIPPLALRGPAITIRKFPKLFGMRDLIERGALTPACAEFLSRCVRARANVIISGGTASGKTTLLNALSEFISEGERVVTIEDTAELQLRRPHVVSLQARPANVEGKGAFTIRDLVVNALRMRPDRLIVGEVRRDEALDMLQAMNTGHDGSLTTVHANDPEDVVSRLETMVLQSGVSFPLRAIRQQIQSAFHIVVQVARAPDGGRMIESVSEFLPMDQEERVPTRAIFQRDSAGLLQQVARPSFAARLPRQSRGLVEAWTQQPA